MPKPAKSASELESLMRQSVDEWPRGATVTIFPCGWSWRALICFKHPEELQRRAELNAIALHLREKFALKNLQ